MHQSENFEAEKQFPRRTADTAQTIRHTHAVQFDLSSDCPPGTLLLHASHHGLTQDDDGLMAIPGPPLLQQSWNEVNMRRHILRNSLRRSQDSPLSQKMKTRLIPQAVCFCGDT